MIIVIIFVIVIIVVIIIIIIIITTTTTTTSNNNNNNITTTATTTIIIIITIIVVVVFIVIVIIELGLKFAISILVYEFQITFPYLNIIIYTVGPRAVPRSGYEHPGYKVQASWDCYPYLVITIFAVAQTRRL